MKINSSYKYPSVYIAWSENTIEKYLIENISEEKSVNRMQVKICENEEVERLSLSLWERSDMQNGKDKLLVEFERILEQGWPVTWKFVKIQSLGMPRMFGEFSLGKWFPQPFLFI